MLRLMNVSRYQLFAVMAAFLLVGCQSTSSQYGSYSGSGSSADPRLEGSDQPQFFTESGVQACAIGAGLGALACLLMGGDDRGSCMAIAAAAGCGVGAGANYVLDSRRSQYANNEQRMNAYIRDVEEDSRKLRQRIATYKVVLEDNRRELNRIKQEIRTKTGDQRRRQAQLAEMQSNRQVMYEEMADLDKKIGLYREVAMTESQSGVQSRAFLSSLQSLERERNDLQQLIEMTYQELPSIVAAS